MATLLDVMDLLQAYVAGVVPGMFRIERQRRVLIKELSQSTGSDVEDLAVAFEAREHLLRHTWFCIGWSVKYNVFTDKVIFERVLDANAVARIAELRETNIRRELKELIQGLDPLQYETLVANLFAGLSWFRSVRTTRRSHDGGIDVTGTYMDPKARIELPFVGQVKRWDSRVDFPEMTKFLGALDLARSPGVLGVYVASNGFTKEAKDAAVASKSKVILYDSDGLVDLMIENSVGVKRTKLEVVSPDEGFWSEIVP